MSAPHGAMPSAYTTLTANLYIIIFMCCLFNVSNPFSLIRRYSSKQPKRNLAALRALMSSQATHTPSTVPWVPSHVVIPSGQIADAAKSQRTHIGVTRGGDFSPVLHAMTSWDDYDSNIAHGGESSRCRYDMDACDISSNMNGQLCHI